jgi:hypothetical protein
VSLLKNILKFLNQRLISIILTIIFFEAIILLLLSFYEPRLDTFLQFIAEISGVVFALIIGFEFERFYSDIRFQKEIKKIFLLIKEELTGNRARLMKILEDGFTGALPWLLQTTTWDIYEERLGEAATINVEDLTKIYHKLNLFFSYFILDYSTC